MGIVIKQSGWNLVITAIGFILGALNVLILAQTFLDDAIYGLWGFILSMAFLIFPLLSFGVHNTIIKYFSNFKTVKERDGFLWQMLFWPILVVVPAFALVFILNDQIADLLSSKNKIVSSFIWHIFFIALFDAYFEIFYAWTKVQMKTIGGNFLKEIFYRAGATLALILLALGIIDQIDFIHSLLFIYALRMIAMACLAFQTYTPMLVWTKPVGTGELIYYSVLMIIAGSVSTALLDLDKVMINSYKIIDNISYYNVAVFIATVIAVPARGMAQITHPLTAGHFNANKIDEVEELYKRSSLNLSVISGFLLVIIICNVQEFYKLMRPEFALGIPVVFFIAIVKYAESLLGSNNAILYNSRLYQVTLWMGLALTAVAIVLNLWLIPIMGISGAAIATCIAYVGYAFAKALYVQVKLKINPWTPQTWSSIALIILSIMLFYFWDFPWNPILNIAVKSIILSSFYIGFVLIFKLSREIQVIFMSLINRSIFK